MGPAGVEALVGGNHKHIATSRSRRLASPPEFLVRSSTQTCEPSGVLAKSPLPPKRRSSTLRSENTGQLTHSEKVIRSCRDRLLRRSRRNHQTEDRALFRVTGKRSCTEKSHKPFPLYDYKAMRSDFSLYTNTNSTCIKRAFVSILHPTGSKFKRFSASVHGN